jgi:hypothetical protein
VDNGLLIKPRIGVHRTYAPRDPVPVREAAETELDASRSVTATGEAPGDQDGQSSGQPGGQRHPDPLPDHPAHEVVVDPQTRERIYRERDVRTGERQRPDQAMLRQRAYGRPLAAAEGRAEAGPQADIEA